MTAIPMRMLVLFGLAVLPVAAAEVSGKWVITGDVAGNAINAQCTFKQDGEKFTGTCKNSNNTESPVAGEVKEDTVTFHYDVEYEGSTYTLNYTGKLQAKAMKGDIEVSGASGEFTAKMD